MKKSILRAVSYLCIAAGVILLIGPFAARAYNRNREKEAAQQYSDTSAEDSDCEKQLEAARAYNERLAAMEDKNLIAQMENEKSEEYESLLNPQGDGMMGYIDIPKINVLMPIYHYSDESSLGNGLGHLHGSSLPAGGKSTHCVLTGHRGLPTNKMLTDLDQMDIGDQFTIHVLNETLVYEVDQIQTVLPDEMDSLSIVDGEDYVTLITCTPYGINDHRLLVRGHRIDNGNAGTSGNKYICSDEFPFSCITCGVIIFLTLLVIWSLRKHHIH